MRNKHVLMIMIAVLLSFSLIAFGADSIQKIQATMSGELKFLVDGQSWSPKDVDGSSLTPLLYNGRTYLPVRALLEDKGVTVGYDETNKTVLIDYSTITGIDKASPVLIKNVEPTSSLGGGKATFKEFTITKNRDLSSSTFNGEMTYTYDLADNAVIMVDGKPVDMTLEELAKSNTKWVIGDSIRLGHDTALGDTLSSAVFTTDNGQGSSLNSKIIITIEISSPPLRIKITVRF